MTFTKYGAFLAPASIFMGLISMVGHFFIIGFEVFTPPFKSTLLEDGFVLLFSGVALGVLVEISRSLAKSDLEKSKL
jgi:hypothetical protein